MDTRHNVQPSVHHVQNILDEFASYDATLQACKEDLWRVIAHVNGYVFSTAVGY